MRLCDCAHLPMSANTLMSFIGMLRSCRVHCTEKQPGQWLPNKVRYALRRRRRAITFAFKCTQFWTFPFVTFIKPKSKKKNQQKSSDCREIPFKNLRAAGHVHWRISPKTGFAGFTVDCLLSRPFCDVCWSILASCMVCLVFS